MNIQIDVTTILDLKSYLFLPKEMSPFIAIMAALMVIAYEQRSIARAKLIVMLTMFGLLVSIFGVCAIGMERCTYFSKYTSNYLILFIGLAGYILGIHPMQNMRIIISQIRADDAKYRAKCKETIMNNASLIKEELCEDEIEKRALNESTTGFVRAGVVGFVVLLIYTAIGS